MITDYFSPLANMPGYCSSFNEWVTKAFFTRDAKAGYEKSDTPIQMWASYGHYCQHPEYQHRIETIKRCIQISHVFGIARLNVMQPKLMERAHRLCEPEMNKTRKGFEDSVDFISNTFTGEGYPVSGMISRLHATERERLNEAIHCFFEGCHYSAVAMAASAIEFRLLDFMEQVSPSTREELQEEPLGSLIRKCIEDPVYSKKLPDRHRPLLELCNRLRIFSVHPKTEVLGQNEATSVIHLAFSFILDPRMRKAST